MSRNAATAAAMPGSVSTAAAATPTSSISHVTPFGVIGVGMQSRVT